MCGGAGGVGVGRNAQRERRRIHAADRLKIRGLSGSFCLDYIAAIVGVAAIAIDHAITLFLVRIITWRRRERARSCGDWCASLLSLMPSYRFRYGSLQPIMAKPNSAIHFGFMTFLYVFDRAHCTMPEASIAPACRATSRPPLNSASVGMLRML